MRNIIFVEGHNGSGKDYLINNVVKHIEDNYPCLRVKVYSPKHYYSEKLKIHSQLNRRDDSVDRIGFIELCRAHADMIDHISRDYYENKADIFIANRFIVSMAIYQQNKIYKYVNELDDHVFKVIYKDNIILEINEENNPANVFVSAMDKYKKFIKNNIDTIEILNVINFNKETLDKMTPNSFSQEYYINQGNLETVCSDITKDTFDRLYRRDGKVNLLKLYDTIMLYMLKFYRVMSLDFGLEPKDFKYVTSQYWQNITAQIDKVYSK